MRMILALLCLASPAAAWDFAPAPLCTLSVTTPELDLVITFDAAGPTYTLTLTRPDGVWPEAADFSMAFVGDRPLAIGTDRHVISPDRRSLTVTDQGFGNVLDGLQFNRRAYASTGDLTLGLDLQGIAAPITAFRGCPAANLA